MSHHLDLLKSEESVVNVPSISVLPFFLEILCKSINCMIPNCYRLTYNDEFRSKIFFDYVCEFYNLILQYLICHFVEKKKNIFMNSDNYYIFVKETLCNC